MGGRKREASWELAEEEEEEEEEGRKERKGSERAQ